MVMEHRNLSLNFAETTLIASALQDRAAVWDKLAAGGSAGSVARATEARALADRLLQVWGIDAAESDPGDAVARLPG